MRQVVSKLKDAYDRHYKKLLLLPIFLLVMSISLISLKVARTGDFINKDVSLKGGVTVTITERAIDVQNLEQGLLDDFPGKDIDVRTIKQAAVQTGVVVTSDIDGTDNEELEAFLASIEKQTGLTLEGDNYSVEVIGSSLGESFFREVFRALVIAFIFMGIVVLIYFRVLVPALAVIMAALSDILVTLSIVNLLGIRLNTAGIAAFLMLIGYSVDTNILLSTKVLKRREGRTVAKTITDTMKTGLMMTFTTMAAIIIALLFTQSDVIGQIMTILLVGLIVDIINTWIGNSGLLRIYLKKK